MAETTLEMARRHVREGEASITRQRELVARLKATGFIATAIEAEILLTLFVSLQASHTDHLRRLMGAT